MSINTDVYANARFVFEAAANEQGILNGAVNYCSKSCIDIKTADISMKERDCFDNCWSNYYEMRKFYLSNFKDQPKNDNN